MTPTHPDKREQAQIGTGNGEKQTKFLRLRERALAALLLCGTVKEAAKECHIAHSTLLRWLDDEDFAAEYHKRRERILEATGTLLRNKTLSAVFVLADMMEGKEVKPMTRVMAARAVLEFAYRGYEMDALKEIRENLARLEAKLDAKGR
jgi:SOS response regulatory protein OraA/RecX